MRNAALLVLLMLVLGCGPTLNEEKTVKVSPLANERMIIDAISRAQTVKVDAKSENGEFNVFVFLEKDQDEVDKAIDTGKVSAKVLKHKLKCTDAAFEAEVPAKSAAVVMLTSVGVQKADVKVKITN
jgi:hypothetical protein